MTQNSLIALNDRWRETGHPYVIEEGGLWRLCCPVCPDLVGKGESLVAALGSALRHNQIHRESAAGSEIPDAGGAS